MGRHRIEITAWMMMMALMMIDAGREMWVDEEQQTDR